GHREQARAEKQAKALVAEDPFAVDRGPGERDREQIETVHHVDEHADRYRADLVAAHRPLHQLGPDLVEPHLPPLCSGSPSLWLAGLDSGREERDGSDLDALARR